MAQVIKSYEVISKSSIGGRLLTVTEVTLGTEYLSGGFLLNNESLGLTSGLIDTAWCSSTPASPGGAKTVLPSVVIVNNVAKLQLYPVGAEKSFFVEEADKGVVATQFKVTICAIGR